MSRKKRHAIELALRKFGAIRPCGRNKSIRHCFTRTEFGLHFWLNTADGLTRMITCAM